MSKNTNETVISVKMPQRTTITYDENQLTISRKGMLNFMTQGFKGKKTIPFRSITSIQLKKPGMTNGYIQFGVIGGNESVGGVYKATQDENTIMFQRSRLKDMEKLKSKIEQYLYNGGQSNTSKPTSNADELLKLKQLLDDGILSQEEFETQKNKVLNN